jgi:hypothetical protein|uniref:Uncharacterized protein n=1 Tax=Siphoviridae sp. ctRiO19 TaxID=2826337 RepID=A0A8S5LWN0_9CAUD|nr:MAG TPA: hypothetical protein [Siphoviridae sp. ctRiO19]
MVWKCEENGIMKEQKSPSTYTANIEDIDDDSYTSKRTGALIDKRIAVGMLQMQMTWECTSEEEAEKLISLTYQNPIICTFKVASVQGGILERAKFRVSKRSVEMIKTTNNDNVKETLWKVSYNLMQKELTEKQLSEVS